MIDAVINDRPGITIMSETYRKTQMEAVHFRQLLKADVLEVAGSVLMIVAHRAYAAAVSTDGGGVE